MRVMTTAVPRALLACHLLRHVCACERVKIAVVYSNAIWLCANSSKMRVSNFVEASEGLVLVVQQSREVNVDPLKFRRLLSCVCELCSSLRPLSSFGVVPRASGVTDFGNWHLGMRSPLLNRNCPSPFSLAPRLFQLFGRLSCLSLTLRLSQKCPTCRNNRIHTHQHYN